MTTSRVESNAAGLPNLMTQLHNQLRSYIEAQYPLRHPTLVAERRALLDTPGMLEQEPYIEGMPGYVPDRTYGELNLPNSVSAILERLAQEPQSPIPAHPYSHQTTALESAVGRDQDLVVVTGTGSGKTETFLLPLLASSILEVAERPASFALPGMRALLLYPMNALVNDQLIRLRRLIGDPRLARWLRDEYTAPRSLRFGMYTSRTPYAGQMDLERNKQRLLPLLEDFLRIEREQPQQASELRQLGRWPACDLQALRESAEQGGITIGASDSELFSRHQMQRWCPDVLVTNYSMLEYMLMRPIERSIFEQTEQWLAQDAANTLLIVLDEAHLYSGATGAEIALLLRRLHARLGIHRSRVRYIVASASLDPGGGSLEPVEKFVTELVGVRDTFATSFSVVRGQRLSAPHATNTSMSVSDEAQMLAQFDIGAFEGRAVDPTKASDAVASVASGLGWPPPTTPEALPPYLAQQIPSLAVFQRLWQAIVGEAVGLSRLASSLFPDTPTETGQQATSALLALSTAAVADDGRPLLPMRAHLFFRGLPPIYACVNPHCTARRAQDDAPAELGALWVTPRLHCECGGRVYELHSHRNCGAAFLCAYAPTEPADFYWHEAGDVPRNHAGEAISQTYLLVGKPHPKREKDVEHIALHITTGQAFKLTDRLSGAPRDDINVARPKHKSKSPSQSQTKNAKNSFHNKAVTADDDATALDKRAWGSCPVCLKRLDTPIGSLATRGEQPFVNLVRRQFELQPASAPASEAAPNMGRKVLLFSDGRQRAARLARDLPREVELDTFRQALLLAVAQRSTRTGQPIVKMDNGLYREFVAVCAQKRLHFFDGTSQEKLLKDIGYFEEVYDGDAEAAEDDQWEPSLSEAYRLALLRQVADRLYSMQRMCVAVVEPAPTVLRALKKRQGPFSAMDEKDLRAFVIAWIESLLNLGAFDSQISSTDRTSILPSDGFDHSNQSTTSERWLDAEEAAKVSLGVSDADVRVMRERLINELCEIKENKVYLRPEKLGLRLALDDAWYRCADCEQTAWEPLGNRCPNPKCGGSNLKRLPGTDPSLRARTDFYREPVRLTIDGQRQPMHMTAEEHTAQLSYRDTQNVSATTEGYELRFQDVGLTLDQPAIDVLSCTTTMEVGVDIGALLGVGLRTVPPKRANYQQRAGRAGRRGAALATVLTYSDNGTHDGHYFAHPNELIAVPAPCPQLSPLNERLLQRHVQAALLQTFFLEHVAANQPGGLSARQYGYLSEALGAASSFFAESGVTSLSAFERWLGEGLQRTDTPLAARTIAWMPDIFQEKPLSAVDKLESVRSIGKSFVQKLRSVNEKYAKPFTSTNDSTVNAAFQPGAIDPKLLDVLFDEGFLPSYAFPREVRSFVIEEWKRREHGSPRIGIRQRPQQSVDIALSEYAPGRELIVDKQTYRVNGVYTDPFPGATVENRVAPIFQGSIPTFLFCPQCEHTRELVPENHAGHTGAEDVNALCPLCGAIMQRLDVLDPPGFSPVGAKPLDNSRIRNDGAKRSGVVRDVKLVVPTTDTDMFAHDMANGRISWRSEEHRKLLITNRGPQGEGFSICKSCGVAASGDAEWLTRSHSRPFLTPSWVASQCTGRAGIWHGALGHVFHSDLLLMRLRWQSSLAYQVGEPWMREACESLAQALAIAATRMLDIASTELRAGWSYTQAILYPDSRMVDFYLFDTLSGGAGYASQVGLRVPDLIERTQHVLDDCPEQCERSCYRCLRSYENRILHERLDRRLAGGLLRAIVSGALPESRSVAEQAQQLTPLARFLEMAGTSTVLQGQRANTTVPLLVHAPNGRSIVVGVRSALRDLHSASHALDQPRDTVLVSDYQLARDLPGVAALLDGNATSKIGNPW